MDDERGKRVFSLRVCAGGTERGSQPITSQSGSRPMESLGLHVTQQPAKNVTTEKTHFLLFLFFAEQSHKLETSLQQQVPEVLFVVFELKLNTILYIIIRCFSVGQSGGATT